MFANDRFRLNLKKLDSLSMNISRSLADLDSLESSSQVNSSIALSLLDNLNVVSKWTRTLPSIEALNSLLQEFVRLESALAGFPWNSTVVAGCLGRIDASKNLVTDSNVTDSSVSVVGMSNDTTLDTILTDHHRLETEKHARDDSLKQQMTLFACEIICAFEAKTIEILCCDANQLLDEIEYWQLVLDSKWRLFRHGIDVFPLQVYRYCSTLGLNGLNSVSDLSQLSIGWIKDNFSHRAMYRLNYLRILKRVQLNSFNEATRHLAQLKALRNSIAACLGQLVNKTAHDEYQVLETFFSEKSTVLAGVLQDLVAQVDGKPLNKITCNPSNKSSSLMNISKMLGKYSALLQVKVRNHKQPSTLSKLWFPTFSGGLILFTGMKAFKIYSGNIVQWGRDIVGTVIDFARNWILEPLKGVYNTVRHKENKLVLIGTESLQSDLNSLERMVIDFARDNGITDQHLLNDIASQVQQGDLSTVMTQYESDIKQPLKNLLLGDLIRSLFIQIQKAKVDSELAISALDKLLKSNELNFAFLTLIPSVGILSWILSILKTWVKLYTVLESEKQYRHRIQMRLTDIERLVTRQLTDRSAYPKAEAKRDLNHGLLLLQINYLRNLEKFINPIHRSSFKQDVIDLESVELTAEMKLRIVDRMWKTFLN